MSSYITLFDSVDTALLPAGEYAYAGYVNGRWANYPQIKARFPRASVLSISISADTAADALDIEPGDAVPHDAVGWVIRQHARKVPRPCLYASVSAFPGIITLLDRAGIARASVRLWTAHYGHGAHICGPGTCRQLSIPADGTQWTDTAQGKNLDQSLLLPGFFGTQPVAYLTATQTEAIMSQLPVLHAPMTDSQLPHEYIRRLQLILSGVWKLYSGAIDGIYGDGTAAAVKALQGQYKLIQDGSCGPLTWAVVIGG